MSARRALCVFAAMICWFIEPLAVRAQEATKGEGTKEGTRPAKTLDASYVTDDFFAAVAIQPARLMTSPALKGLPVADVAKGMKEQFGVEPQQIEQVILLLPRDFAVGFPT